MSSTCRGAQGGWEGGEGFVVLCQSSFGGFIFCNLIPWALYCEYNTPAYKQDV